MPGKVSGQGSAGGIRVFAFPTSDSDDVDMAGQCQDRQRTSHCAGRRCPTIPSDEHSPEIRAYARTGNDDQEATRAEKDRFDNTGGIAAVRVRLREDGGVEAARDAAERACNSLFRNLEA